MPVTATFEASFTQFRQAVDQATTKLKDFQTDANKVQSSLNRIGSSFSGQQIISQATLAAKAVTDIGGATKLTQSEQARLNATLTEAIAKYTALGQQAPQSMTELASATKQAAQPTAALKSELSGVGAVLGAIGISLSVGALVNFGRNALAAASDIQKMGTQTGFTNEQVQQFQYIAGQSSTNVEALVKGVQNLQQRLGDDTTGAAGAMAKLRINADDFNRLNTHDQIFALSDALRAETDVNARASEGAALFGKTWSEIGPAILSDMRTVGDQAPVMSDAVVKAAADAENALKRWEQASFVWAGNIILAIEAARRKQADFNAEFGGNFGRNQTFGGNPAQTTAALDAAALAAALKAIPPAALPAISSLDGLNQSAAYLDLVEQHLTKTVTDHIDAARKAAEADKEHAKILKEAADLLRENINALYADIDAVAGKVELANDKAFDADQLEAFKAELASVALAFDDLGDVAAADGKRMNDEIDSAMKPFGKGRQEVETFNDELDRFATNLRHLAQVSDGTFGGIVKDIAELVSAWNLAAKAADDYAKATTTAGKALAIAQGVTAVGAATQGGGAKGIVGGALAGAELGSIFGPWGTAAGAAIGAVVGIFRTGISEIEKMGRSATDSFVSTLQSALTVQQQMEVHQLIAAGASAKWAGEVVGLRQAYLLAGETSEAAASKAAEWTTRLWLAEKQGGNAVALLIDQINIELAQMTEESKKAKDEADKAAAAAKALADELDSAVKSFSGEELFHQADIAVQAVEKIGGVTKLTADEQKSLHDLLEKTIDKYLVMGQEVPPALLAIWRGLNDISVATTNISKGALKAYQDLLALRGFASGGGGEGESETRNASDILAGLSASEAEQIYLNVIAPGSKPSDWERVKHQYGYAMGTGGFMNFGAGTPAILHGEEKVVTRAQDVEMKGLRAEVKGLREDLRRVMQAMPYQLASAVQLRH